MENKVILSPYILATNTILSSAHRLRITNRTHPEAPGSRQPTAGAPINELPIPAFDSSVPLLATAGNAVGAVELPASSALPGKPANPGQSSLQNLRQYNRNSILNHLSV